jgi:hypothetical protein
MRAIRSATLGAQTVHEECKRRDRRGPFPRSKASDKPCLSVVSDEVARSVRTLRSLSGDTWHFDLFAYPPGGQPANSKRWLPEGSATSTFSEPFDACAARSLNLAHGRRRSIVSGGSPGARLQVAIRRQGQAESVRSAAWRRWQAAPISIKSGTRHACETPPPGKIK